jgi:hypothetical protein
LVTIGILFFGGYRSTEADVQAWAHSAMKQNSIISQVHPFHYPENASAGDPLEHWSSSDAFKAIHDMGQVDQLMIVGHSSGCAYANEIAGKLLARERFDHKLIALDGFCPAKVLLDGIHTEVWSARNSNAVVHSLNYWICKMRAGDKFHVYEANVERRWPLHFSLVNEAVDDKYADIIEGYRNCRENLKVLGLDAVQSQVAKA